MRTRRRKRRPSAAIWPQLDLSAGDLAQLIGALFMEILQVEDSTTVSLLLDTPQRGDSPDDAPRIRGVAALRHSEAEDGSQG
jgi:hypothetical protein